MSRPQISTLGVATGFYHGISLWRFALISALTLPPVSLPPQAFVASYWGASGRVAGAGWLAAWLAAALLNLLMAECYWRVVAVGAGHC